MRPATGADGEGALNVYALPLQPQTLTDNRRLWKSGAYDRADRVRSARG